jgi:hypothetical protein
MGERKKGEWNKEKGTRRGEKGARRRECLRDFFYDDLRV